MFETATLSYGPPAKRVLTTAMGFTGQAIVIACAVLGPLISPQTIGRAFLVTGLVAPGAPPAPPPPGPQVVPQSSHAASTQVHQGILTTPFRIPPVAAMIIDDFPAATGSGGRGVQGATGNAIDGITGGLLTDLMTTATRALPIVHVPEPIRNEAVVATTAPVRPPRITQLRMATPIHKVEPVYPGLAKQARVSGTVELLGVLGTDGRIHELKVLRGHPLLVGAALDAVRQWVFEPTLLNGQAVEVAAPITVNFILN